MSKKIRTDAQKLAIYKRSLREIWHRSPMYWTVYNRAKVRAGILKCEKCGREQDARLCEIDHISPIVLPEKGDEGIAVWVARLNCAPAELQALCEDCHKSKTTKENKQRVRRKNVPT